MPTATVKKGKRTIFARRTKERIACIETCLCSKCMTEKNKKKFYNPWNVPCGNTDIPSNDWVNLTNDGALECQQCGYRVESSPE